MGWSSVDWMHFLWPLRFTASSHGSAHQLCRWRTTALEALATGQSCSHWSVQPLTVLMAQPEASHVIIGQLVSRACVGWRTPEPCWEDIPGGLLKRGGEDPTIPNTYLRGARNFQANKALSIYHKSLWTL